MNGAKQAFEESVDEIPCDVSKVDEEVDDEDYDDDYEDDDDGYSPTDFGQLMSNFFVTEDGENVAEALVGIKKAIDTHNKIFLKYVNANKK